MFSQTFLAACVAFAVTAVPVTPSAARPTATVKRLKVRVESIRVARSESYGLFGEPGVEAEWRLRVTVNGEAREWADNHVRDNTDHLLGFDFYVDVVGATTNISVRTSGYEIDDTSANDKLPAAEATHGSADNWGIGRTHTLRASDADFDYTIYYTITPLEG